MKLSASFCLIVPGLVLLALAGRWMLGAGLPGQGGGDVDQHDLPPATVPAEVVAARISTVGSVPSHRPDGWQPKVDTGLRDATGASVEVSCTTCHATREPNRANGAAGVLPTKFHPGLIYAHGNLSCLSCHNADDYDTLRVADGGKVAFAQAQQLCAQCHGPQTRDYRHGSHGGMTGYWDTTKGERVRRTCTECHDPHAPAYPELTPIFPPRDAAARQQADRALTETLLPHHE